jgi:hypothetical protein
VALLRVMLPEGERRYLRDCGIATLPLAQLNAVLAPLGYVLVGSPRHNILYAGGE